MFYLGIFAVLWSAMTCSLGFTMDRSAALVPPTWDMAPSLDTYQRVDSALNSKTQVTSTDRILQAVDAKVSAKLTERIADNQTRDKRATTESREIGMKLINNTASTMRNDASDSSEENTNVAIISRNVILLLIDERNEKEKGEENPWKDYKNRLPFAIEGFLQRCNNKIETNGTPLDGALISENKEKDCDCERILRSNIGELLSWARQTRGMTTGAVSGSNFSIPFFPRYKFDVSNESNVKLELQENKHDFNDALQIIDLSDEAKSVPSLITADPKTEAMNYDSTWDVFDVFSKIRMAIFQSLLESLSRNRVTSEDDFSLHRSFPIKPTVTNLIENTIKKLKSVPNHNGYMLVAVVPRSEGAAIVDLMQRETSPKDTLLVMMQICAGNKKSVPFVAQGPNNEILREVVTIEELPIIIKKAIASNFHGAGCTNRKRRDIPIVSHLPIEIFSQELPARKRVARDKDAVEKLETSKLTDIDIKDTVSTVKTTIIEKEKQARSSTSSKTMQCGLATALVSVAASVVAMAV
ncbi:uncharacterized protein LOC115237484 [Formica exsecta]|uniref:uncharacterized protein LOC115237484 n=1 Tax=Formica exsecta TaxID=72781 RepID=UPI001142C3DD|nr:uncharacterized protein LOC115237484 [Formica exsecta]